MRPSLGLPHAMRPLFWAMTLQGATVGAYASLWPLWIERLGAPIPVVGLMLGSSGVIRLGALAPAAAVADRIGYRRTLLLGSMATSLGLLSAAFATHWPELAGLLIGRALGDSAFPLAQTLVAAQPREQRMRSFALVFTVGPSLALAIAPLASGAMVAIWGIRAAFILAAGCALVAIPALSRITDPPGRGTRPASSYRAALADPGFRLVAPLLFASLFSLWVGAALAPTFLADVRQLAPATIAALSAASALGSAAFGLVVARLRRLQAAPLVAVAAAVALTTVGLLLFRTQSAVVMLVVAFGCLGGLYATWAMLDATLGQLATAAHRTRAFALLETVGGLAVGLGPIVAGRLYERRSTLPFDVGVTLALVVTPALLLAQHRATRLRLGG